MSTSTPPTAPAAENDGIRALLYHAVQVAELARLLNGGAGDLRDEPAPLEAEDAGGTISRLMQQVSRRQVTSRIGLEDVPSAELSHPLNDLHRLLLANAGHSRLLVSRSSWNDDVAQPQVPAPEGTATEVRVVGLPIPEVTLLDGTVAVLGGLSARLTVIRDRRTVRVLESLFDTAWDGAVDYDVVAAMDNELCGAIGQGGPLAQVLPLLGAGWTDAAAARELGWSLRTYRRRVADLMERLRARSRFEAGMRTAQLQLHRQSD